MVKFLTGAKGEGKSRRLIDLANENVNITDGHLVFITHNRRQMHDLHRDVRFVETEKGLLTNYREFVGFILGVLSQNSDITHIYVNGLNSIICNISESDPGCAELIELKKRLDELAESENVSFTITIHGSKEGLPEEIQAVLI